jgi:hypothetical protein
MTEQSPSPAASAKKVFGVGQKAFAQMTSPPTPSTTVSLSPPYTTSQSQSSSSDHGTDVGELQLLARLRSRNQVLVRVGACMHFVETENN